MIDEINTDDYKPDIAIPPGETLRETLASLGMSQVDLANRTGKHKKTINEIIKGKAPILPDFAMELEKALDVPAIFWLNLEANYQATLLRIKEQKHLESELELVKRFPYTEMARLGWIKRTRNPVEKVSNLLSFFAIASLTRLEFVEKAAFRKARSKKASAEALSAWLRQGEIEAMHIKTTAFDAKGFMSVLPELRKLTVFSPDDFVIQLQDHCSRNGVAVVFTPHLNKTYANGACRWLSPLKALVQLSIRNKYEDIFWFTFFHEAAHLLRHGKKEIFIDCIKDAATQEEIEADRFAANILIPPSKYREFVIKNDYSRNNIVNFAKELEISPAIVVGRLLHEKLIPYNTALHSLRRKFEWVN